RFSATTLPTEPGAPVTTHVFLGGFLALTSPLWSCAKHDAPIDRQHLAGKEAIGEQERQSCTGNLPARSTAVCICSSWGPDDGHRGVRGGQGQRQRGRGVPVPTGPWASRTGEVRCMTARSSQAA